MNGGSRIRKLRARHGIAFFMVVSFSTLFLNLDVFPATAQRDVVVEQQTPIEGNRPSNIKEKAANPLFKLTINPFVPSFILQGNYVIHSTSPQKDCTAYLYPDEWETVGDIYLKDTVQNKWTRLELDQLVRREMWNNQEPAETLYTPKKKILWLNNEEFLTIVGYAHGTVSTGGDLLKVNRVTGKAEMMYPAYQKLNQEVIDIEMSEEKLTLWINVTDTSGLSLEQGVISASLNNLTTLAEQEPVSDKSTTNKK